jgi:hypothetical protein
VRRNNEVSHIRVVLPVWRPDVCAALEVHLRDVLRLYTVTSGILSGSNAFGLNDDQVFRCN